MKPPNVPCPPNNPYCHGIEDSVPIDSYIWILIVVCAIIIYLIINKVMNLKKAIKILKKHQKWRLGAETKQTEPKKLTEAINLVLYAVKYQQKYIKSGEIGDYEELKKL